MTAERTDTAPSRAPLTPDSADAPKPARLTRGRAGRRPTVVLSHRFFDPDVTTYAQMLRVLADDLTANGNEVTVFSTQPGYNNVYTGRRLARAADESGVEVIRRRIPFAGSSLGRLVGGVGFAVQLVLFAARRRGRIDVLTVSTVPPVLMGLAGLAASRVAKARLVYHCMDLYPEIAVDSKLLKPGLWQRIAARLDSYTARHADTVVVLSEDMARTLRKRAPAANIKIINNFSLAESTGAPRTPLRRELEQQPAFRVLFAGNLGRFQGLTTLVEGFARAASDLVNPELVLMGDGAAKRQLQMLARELGVEDKVRLIPFQPIEVAVDVTAHCDLSVISLVPGVIGSAYPSKTMTCLQAGTRVLCIAETDSELARLIEDRDLGVAVPPGDADQVAAALVSEFRRSITSEDRERSQQVAAELFSRESLLPRWRRLFRSLANDHESDRS